MKWILFVVLWWNTSTALQIGEYDTREECLAAMEFASDNTEVSSWITDNYACVPVQ